MWSAKYNRLSQMVVHPKIIKSNVNRVGPRSGKGINRARLYEGKAVVFGEDEW